MVLSCVVSEPVVGSLTPNAWSRSSPVAILGQQRALLRVGAVPQQRAHRVHLRVAGAGVGAAPVDLFEDDRRLVDAEAGAAVRFGNQRREVAGVGERLDERVGIGAGGIELAPVAVGKVLAEVADPGAQILMKVRHDGGGDHTWVAGPLHPAKRLRYARTPVARSTPPRLCARTGRVHGSEYYERPHADACRSPRGEPLVTQASRALFGVPGGGGNLDLIEAAGRSALPFVLTATETGAALAAMAQAEITGRPGACLTTLGPGAASVVNGVACALLDRAPLLVFTDSHGGGAEQPVRASAARSRGAAPTRDAGQRAC